MYHGEGLVHGVNRFVVSFGRWALFNSCAALTPTKNRRNPPTWTTSASWKIMKGCRIKICQDSFLLIKNNLYDKIKRLDNCPYPTIPLTKSEYQREAEKITGVIKVPLFFSVLRKEIYSVYSFLYPTIMFRK